MQNKILVTGAGALLGQGILRCLQFSKKSYSVISADPDIYASGHALADKSYIIPYASEAGYMSRIEEIIVQEGIDLILVGTDVELPIFAENQNRLEKEYNVKLVISKASVIKIANDKWLTAEFLRKHEFPYPKSALTIDKRGIEILKNDANYPYIAKPVDGARSKGIKIVNNETEMIELCSYQNNLVVQEMIGDDEGEFTTGCIVTNGVCKAVVSLVRDLRDGNTWRAYRTGSSIYDDKIAQIAEALGVEGPANFQYRIKNGEPVIFEINCRFSGTTPIRYFYGFNEVEALVEYYLNNTEIKTPQLKTGTVLRTFSDVFIANEELDDFKKNKEIEDLKTVYYPFKPKK